MATNDGAAERSGPEVIISVEDDEGDDAARGRFSFRRLLQFMGPGILMSIAYVDPGNLESDLQVGAQAGYVLLWLLLLSTVMGLVVQMQAAKLGVVTGRHLAQHCRQQYPTAPRIALWLMAELAIVGSDVQEVIGSAIALSLLSGGRLPLWGGVLLTAVDSFALLFIERLGIRVLEGFFGCMVGVMVATFGVMYVRADVPLGEVARGFTVPRLPRKDLPVAVALMGSLIMPHNIYLHSALVQTRRLSSNRPAAKREALAYFGIESALSLVVAVVINLFITAVFARGFFGADLPDIGLQNAGRYLGDTYGEAVVYIWALGLLAAGQASTMTGTYTGQFVMSGYLDLKVSPWARVAITRAVAIAPTLAVALLCGGARGDGDGTQLDALNQGLNLLQSIQLPFALVPVLTFTSSPAIMGEFANSAPTVAVCWSIAALVVAINGMAVYEVAYETVVADPWVSGSALGLVVAAYMALIGYMVVGPQSMLGAWLGFGKSGGGGAGIAEAPAEGAGGGGEEGGDRRLCGGKAACGCCAGCRCRAAVGAGEGAEGGVAGDKGAVVACGCSVPRVGFVAEAWEVAVAEVEAEEAERAEQEQHREPVPASRRCGGCSGCTAAAAAAGKGAASKGEEAQRRGAGTAPNGNGAVDGDDTARTGAAALTDGRGVGAGEAAVARCCSRPLAAGAEVEAEALSSGRACCGGGGGGAQGAGAAASPVGAGAARSATGGQQQRRAARGSRGGGGSRSEDSLQEPLLSSGSGEECGA